MIEKQKRIILYIHIERDRRDHRCEHVHVNVPQIPLVATFNCLVIHGPQCANGLNEVVWRQRDALGIHQATTAADNKHEHDNGKY